MTQDTWPTPQGRAAQAASVFSDILTGPGLINLEAAIAAAITLDRESQAARLANALAYCAEADNESMEQARTIRAQAEQIEKLRRAYTTINNAFLAEQARANALRVQLRSASIEAQAARQCLVVHVQQPRNIEPDEFADDLINDEIAAIKRRDAQP